jgi:CO/xanthine dehydrogenase Mo-binding subunit
MTTVTAPGTTSILATGEYRVEGPAKVSGRAEYAADFRREGMLWAAFTLGTEPHAKIRSVDTARARAIPGVRAVLTGADVPNRFFGRALMDWPVLAHEKVHFVGQYVAAVAADTREIAEAAAQTIVVDYEELPTVFDAEEALKDDAVILHEDPSRYPFLYGPAPKQTHPNIQGRVLVERGDVEAAFASAPHVFEHRFSTPRHHGGYLEPHATLVWLDPDGTVHLITTNKAPGSLKRQLCVCDGIPAEKVVVEQAYIGGDFGAKGLSVEEFPCYFLAKATGKPVKYVRPYMEDIRSTNTRHATELTLKSAVDAQGNFLAFSARVIYNGGGYAAGKPIPFLIPGLWTKTPYRLPNARAELISVYTNTVPGGHVRAPGDVQICFALESHVDMIAQALGRDPIDFRAQNALVGLETDMDDLAYVEPRAKEVLEILRREGRWDEPLPPGRGKGIALSVRHIGHGSAQVQMLVLRDGTIEVRTPLMDQGAGSLTMMQRVIAQTLGVGTERIRFVRETSNSTFLEMGPGASRVTHVTGGAAQAGAEAIKAKLQEHGWDGSAATYAASAARACGSEASFEVVGAFKGEPKPGDPESHNFSGYLVDLTVDPETGALTIHQAIHVADVGTIINPMAHQGQIDGGFVFGLGHALTEDLIVEDGHIVNLTFADYKLPTQMDLPPFRTILVPTPGGPGPFGSKMIGESSTSAVAPAIANAVARACGARITRLPITSERIYDATRSAGVRS